MIDFTLNIVQVLIHLAFLSAFIFILDCISIFAHAHTHAVTSIFNITPCTGLNQKCTIFELF